MLFRSSQRDRNTYFKGAICWLKILIILLEAKQVERFDRNETKASCFEVAEAVFRISISKFEASSGNYKNISKEVSK